MVITLLLKPVQSLCGHVLRHSQAPAVAFHVARFIPVLLGALHILPALLSQRTRHPPLQARSTKNTLGKALKRSNRHKKPFCASALAPSLRRTAADTPACALGFPSAAQSTGAHIPRPSVPLLHIFFPAGELFSSLSAYLLAGCGSKWAVRAIKRTFRRSRAQRRMISASPINEISIVTFNIRGIMDRWTERAPYLRQCIKQLDADVIAFQEVLTGQYQQDRMLVGEEYQIFECRAALGNLVQQGGGTKVFASIMSSMLDIGPMRSLMLQMPLALESWREQRQLPSTFLRNLRDVSIAPFYGNSIATRLPPAAPPAPSDTLILGSFRAAQRVCLQLPASSPPSGPPLRLWVVNTHLDHAEPATRAQQAEAICKWMHPLRLAGGCTGVVVTGDLNAPPGEAVHGVFNRHGYTSAHLVANGHEPESTWPSGLVAPLMDEGEPHCADYVYIYEPPGCTCRVAAAQVAGNTPHPQDPTLYPSDHLALRVTLRVAPSSAAAAAVVS